MHQPRPYGLFGAEGLDSDGLAFADSLMQRVTNLRAAGGLDALRLTRALPGGGSVTATDAGGVQRVVISRPTVGSEGGDSTAGSAGGAIPMLFSGAMRRVVTRPGEAPSIEVSDQTRRRLSGYSGQWESKVPRVLELERFRVPYAPQFGYFLPRGADPQSVTQYHRLRATWYSGAMSEVVQIVSGYGRCDLRALPKRRVERSTMALPDVVYERVREQARKKPLLACRGRPHPEGQIVYDYKFGLTNGVAFGSDGKPWLLQIDARGVYAMPLPLVPETTTPAFADYIAKVGDAEIELILQRFGGMPSGETFPAEAAVFQAWERAGVIIRVCDTGAFFQHNAMYAAGGWSFNSRGDEAFNTAWRHGADGLMEVASFTLRLRLGALPAQALRANWAPGPDDPQAQAVFHRYVEGLAAAGRGSDEFRAVMFKLRRSAAAELIQRSKTASSYEAEWRYWSELKMAPIAVHSGDVARVASGPVYSPGRNPKAQGRLKFPELTGQGVESFIMVSPDYTGPPVKCDTVVFGCYVGDQLRTAKYFYDEAKFFEEEESTFEDIMIVGSWGKTTTSGLSSLAGNFYTTDFDKRDTVAPSTTSTTIVGTDLGYSTPAYSTPGIMMRVGTVSRARYYSHKIEERSKNGEALDMAVCVPAYERDAILYPFARSFDGGVLRESVERHGIRDPNSYELWCHDSIYHYIGVTQNGCLGDPPSVDGAPVYVDSHLYLPTEVSDYADAGEWLGLPPGGFLDVTAICGPYTTRGSVVAAGGVLIGGDTPQIEEYTRTSSTPREDEGELWLVGKGAGAVRAHQHIPRGFYFAFSPENNTYFEVSANKIVFGERELLHIKDGQSDLKWGFSRFYDKDRTGVFVGVINE